MEIQDVRLVYAPPKGIGNFGGETDNWRWPRHTGDWSFYRAYVSPAGKSAPYAKENVPFKPKHWLKVSAEGASPGDLVFVAGYPGFTDRFAPFAETKQIVEWWYPRVVRRNRELIALLDEIGKTGKETGIRVATKKRGLHNTLTNYEGVLEGFRKGDLLAKKESLEKELTSWIARGTGSPGEVRRRSSGIERARSREGEDPRARRHPHRPARQRELAPAGRAQDSTSCRSSAPRRTSTATPSTRSETGAVSARRRTAFSARTTPRPIAPCCAISSSRRRCCRRTSASRRSTEKSA